MQKWGQSGKSLGYSYFPNLIHLFCVLNSEEHPTLQPTPTLLFLHSGQQIIPWSLGKDNFFYPGFFETAPGVANIDPFMLKLGLSQNL